MRAFEFVDVTTVDASRSGFRAIQNLNCQFVCGWTRFVDSQKLAQSPDDHFGLGDAFTIAVRTKRQRHIGRQAS